MKSIPAVRCPSPIHVHVNDQTPVYVHVKKTKTKAVHKSSGENMLSQPLQPKDNERPTIGGLTVIRRHRYRSPSQSSGFMASVAAPWVPAPAKTSKSTRYAWQGSSHRLEIATPANEAHSWMRPEHEAQDDPDSDEETRIQSRERQYEKRIETLMNQNATLKKELQIRSQQQDENNCDDVVNADGDKTSAQLLKHLDKVDRSADCVATQMSTLSEALKRHKKERSIDSTSLATTLASHRQCLLDKIAALDTDCQQLRRLLRAERNQVVGHKERTQLAEQVKTLQKVYETSVKELADKDMRIEELKAMCDMSMNEVSDVNKLQDSFELSNSKLKRQLRQRDIECSQMAIDLRNTQNQLSQEHNEIESLRSRLNSLQGLRPTKSHRKHQDSDLETGSVFGAVERNDSLQIELNSLKTYCDKLRAEKTQATCEMDVLRVRVSELETVIERMSEDLKKELAMVSTELQERTVELAARDREVERFKAKLSTMEYKHDQACTDLSDMQSKVREYEIMIEEYRSQITRTRREADEASCQLESSRRDLSLFRKDSQVELDKVRQNTQSRLAELERMPKLLESAERKVQQLSNQLEHYTKLNSENCRVIADLTTKINEQADYESERRELLRRVADREETLHQSNIQVQEVMCDNAALKRRLDSVLADNQRKIDVERNKLSSRERAQRAQILDLETQLSQVQTEMTRLKRDKDESERRSSAQLHDVRDRLEQSHSTNRSLQNYVEFLKTSYSSVFGEHIAASTPLATSSLYQRAI